MKPALQHRTRAQSLTELALIMPLLALLLIGLIEVGFLLQAHVQVASAAREAARAAAQYSSLRYAPFVEDTGSNATIPTCVGTVDGWTLQQTIEQAIVRYPLDNNGCPTTTGTIVSSALGRLSPTRAAAGTTAPPCPTGNATGWVVGVVTSPAYTPTANGGTANPTPGAQGTLTLCYPYRLLLATDLFRWGSPLWINKSVVFTYQQ